MRVRSLPLVFLFLATIGCSGSEAPDPESTTSIVAFPATARVERTEELRLDGLGEHYFGGAGWRLVRGPGGLFYLSTQEPIQVIAFDRGGHLHWAHNGEETPEGQFLSPPILAVVGDELAVFDAAQQVLYRTDQHGLVSMRGKLGRGGSAIFSSPAGTLLSYPSAHPDHLVDRFSPEMEYLGPAIPYVGEDAQRAGGNCVAVGLAGGDYSVAFGPTREITHLSAEGLVLERWRIDEPEFAENVEARTRKTQAMLETLPAGVEATTIVFTRMERTADGNLLLSSFLEKEQEVARESARSIRPTFEGICFRVTPSGEPIQILRGFGPLRDGVLCYEPDRYCGIDMRGAAIHFYSLVADGVGSTTSHVPSP